MNTAPNLSQNLRDTAKDARDGRPRSRQSGLIRVRRHPDDLQALRDDFARLAEQVGEILADKGNAAWRRAKTSVDSIVSDAQDKGRDAAGAVRDVSDNFVGAIDDSLKERPYTTLAIVAGLGFLFGATWRR